MVKKSVKPNVKVNEKIPVIIADISEKASVRSVNIISNAILSLNKQGVIKMIGGKGYFTAIRNLTFSTLKKELGINKVRGIMLDSDVILECDYKTLADVMKEADEKNINFVIPYKNGNSSYSLWHKDMNPYTQDEYNKLKDGDKIEYSGLGFYYGDIPLDYIFHSDVKGEDHYFFEDNKLDVRVIKSIKTVHYVTVPLRVV